MTPAPFGSFPPSADQLGVAGAPVPAFNPLLTSAAHSRRASLSYPRAYLPRLYSALSLPTALDLCAK